VRFISIKNIKPFQPINWSAYEKYITPQEHAELIKRCRPEYDDVVFPRIGTLGYAKRIDFHDEVSIFVGLGLVKPIRECVLPKFLEYYLNTPYVAKLSGKRANGSGRMTLPLEESRRFPFPVPPFREQGRIVAKLEELFSELDKGIEVLTTAREQLEAYRQSVLKYAFEGALTADLRATAPAWRNTHLGDEIEYLTSGSRGWAEYYADRGDIFIRAQNLKYDRLNLTDIAFVKLPAGNTEGIRTRVRVGDVLVTITGANVTKTGVVDAELGKAYVSQHVALCRPRASIAPRFLYWYLLSEAHGRRQLNTAAYGAGKPGLSLDNIRDVSLSLPALQEQAVVVERIEAALSVEQPLSESIKNELRRTRSVRHSILNQAFLGQLVAQDSTDEPASVLLERIRAEREVSKAAKNKRNERTSINREKRATTA
jgi:type I restriction enzyme S subunit